MTLISIEINDDILIGSGNGMATRFEASTLRPTGRTSRGVRAMKLKAGDTLADVNILHRGENSQRVLTRHMREVHLTTSA